MAKDKPSPTMFLGYHLEQIIWNDAEEGEHLNATEVYRRMDAASPEQLRRAQAALDQHKEKVFGQKA